LGSTGILPVGSEHGQDARATSNRRNFHHRSWAVGF
jgi:hypothetical protein